VQATVLGQVVGELVNGGERPPLGVGCVIGGLGREHVRKQIQGSGGSDPGVVGVAPVVHVGAAQDRVRGPAGQVDAGLLLEFTYNGGRGGLARVDHAAGEGP